MSAVDHLRSLARRGRPVLAPVRRRVAPRVDALVIRRFTTLARRGEKVPGAGVMEDAATSAFARLVERRAATGAVSKKMESTVLTAFRALANRELNGSRSGTVRQAVVDNFHRVYYHNSRQTWKQTRWRGVDVWKNPLDLWIYQEILHEVRPDVIVEAGTKFGGSAYFLANICDLLGTGRVVTIDITPQPDRPTHDRITYLTGSSTDPAVIEQVDQIVAGGRIVVLLDSDHNAPHVLAELRAWHSRVPVGSYIIVEDTNIHGHPVFDRHGPGPMEAVDEFLAENDQFVVDEAQHKFMFTFNPRGYLKRVK